MSSPAPIATEQKSWFGYLLALHRAHIRLLRLCHSPFRLARGPLVQMGHSLPAFVHYRPSNGLVPAASRMDNDSSRVSGGIRERRRSSTEVRPRSLARGLSIDGDLGLDGAHIGFVLPNAGIPRSVVGSVWQFDDGGKVLLRHPTRYADNPKSARQRPDSSVGTNEGYRALLRRHCL